MKAGADHCPLRRATTFSSGTELVSSIAGIAPYLLLVAASREVAHSDRGPAQLRHNLCQSSKGAGGPVALRDFEQIQERLTADALQPVIEVNFAPHALQLEPPRIGGLCRGPLSRFYPLFSRWHGADPNRSKAEDFTKAP